MLETVKNIIQNGFGTLTVVSVIDIFLTAVIIYIVLDWIKDSQAMQVVKGVIIILAATQISRWLGLTTIYYIYQNVITVGILALVIMFQPELRRTLEKIGSTKLKDFITSISQNDDDADRKYTIEQVVAAVSEMSKTKTGALIVFERETNLKDIIDTGTYLDSVATKQLLINIFTPNTPLHDGAVILGKGTYRVKAAGCLLPLTQNRNLSQEIGTRHRSAIGLSEISDALVVVVSEETGIISYALNGKLSRFMDAKALTALLTEALNPNNNKPLLMKGEKQ